MKSKFNKFVVKILDVIKKQEMSILPGQLAFFFVLSMIPIIALLGSLGPIFNVSHESIIVFLEKIIPKSVVEMFIPIITGKSMNVETFIFYVSSFILASNGTHSIILSSNAIYGLENNNYIKRKIKAIFMAIVLVVLLIFVLIVPAFGDIIIKFIAKLVGNNLLGNNIILMFLILKYPISIILIYLNIKLLYITAPDRKIKSKYTNIGSVFATIGWIIATEIYSVYVDVFSKYNIFYGSISNVLILMLWVYILAFIFVMGMVFNAGYYNSEDENIL